MKKTLSWMVLLSAAAVSAGAEEKLEKPKAAAGYLGATANPIDKEDRADFGLKEGQTGLLVMKVEKDGPAGKAGLKEGDVLLALNGKPIETPQTFGAQVRAAKPGSEAKLKILRANKEQELAVKVGEAPAQQEESGPNAEQKKQMEAAMAMLPPEMREKVKALQAKAEKLAKKYKEEGLSDEEMKKRIQEDLRKDAEELRKSMQGGGGQ